MCMHCWRWSSYSFSCPSYPLKCGCERYNLSSKSNNFLKGTSWTVCLLPTQRQTCLWILFLQKESLCGDEISFQIWRCENSFQRSFSVRIVCPQFWYYSFLNCLFVVWTFKLVYISPVVSHLLLFYLPVFYLAPFLWKTCNCSLLNALVFQ